MKKPLVITVLALLVTVPVLINMTRETEAKPVEVSEVNFIKITPSILASGSLIYENQVTLVSEVIGLVEEVNVEEGDFVTAGQLLLELDSRDITAEVDQLRASVEQSQLNIKRQKLNYDAAQIKLTRFDVLQESGLLEEMRYDELKTELGLAEVELHSSREGLKQAEANLERAQQRLIKTKIRSPLDGQVLSVDIKKGETAVPSAMSIAGGNLMVIASTEKMFAEINVDEADVARVSVGQEAWIVPASFPDHRLVGHVVKISLSPKQEPGQSKSYPVTVWLEPNADITFHPGMSGRAEIVTAQDDDQAQLGVPLRAIQYEDHDSLTGQEGRPFVFLMNKGKAHRQPVETGIADDDNIEILNGLAQSDHIIVGPAKTLRFLREGDLVSAELGQDIETASSSGKRPSDKRVSLQ